LSPAPQPPVQELRLLTFPAKPPAASFLPRLFACSARFATFSTKDFLDFPLSSGILDAVDNSIWSPGACSRFSSFRAF
jgi:hypothetical protein